MKVNDLKYGENEGTEERKQERPKERKNWRYERGKKEKWVRKKVR